MSKRSGAGGFSLLEVLVAMSMFMVLGAGLVALMSRAMDFLEGGAAGSEVQDKARDFVTPFARDVGNVAVERRLEPGKPTIRFLSDQVGYDSDGSGSVDYLAQRLVFVRHTTREVTDEKVRDQGIGGLEEVIWIAVPTRLGILAERDRRVSTVDEDAQAQPADLPDAGLLTLYRGVRAPIGGPMSLFDRQLVRRLEKLVAVADPLMNNVLHFSVEFEGVRNQWTSGWDSTRSIEPSRYLKFPWYVGPDSFEDARDDVSPRALRVTFVFERTGSGANPAKLLDTIGDEAKRITVDRPSLLAGAGEPYVKVGSEWIQHSGSVRSDGTLAIVNRGARGTLAKPHEAGTLVRTGMTVVRTILIPSYREDWNSQ
jgi:hypothetical protein